MVTLGEQRFGVYSGKLQQLLYVRMLNDDVADNELVQSNMAMTLVNTMNSLSPDILRNRTSTALADATTMRFTKMMEAISSVATISEVSAPPPPRAPSRVVFVEVVEPEVTPKPYLTKYAYTGKYTDPKP
jgi:hypothetical protein